MIELKLPPLLLAKEKKRYTFTNTQACTLALSFAVNWIGVDATVVVQLLSDQKDKNTLEPLSSLK